MVEWRDRAGAAYSEVFLYKGSKILAVGGGVALIFLMLVTLVTVVVRLLPIGGAWVVGGYEYSQLAMSALATLAIAYTWYKNGHIRIGIFRDRWAPRKVAVLDTISAFLGTAFAAALVYAVWDLTMSSLALGRSTELKEVPLAPFQVFYCIVMAHVFLVLLRSFIGLFAKALGSRFGYEPYLGGQ